VRPLPSLLAADLEEIKIETSACLLLREDLDALTSDTGDTTTVRLLPHFDPYLLAHREKDHLVSARHYKRVYRNQGWISPVVLTNGSLAGIWRHEVQSRKLRVTVEPFAKLPRAAREAVVREATDLAKFFDSTLELVVL
jgi:hypothetical protein